MDDNQIQTYIPKLDRISPAIQEVLYINSTTSHPQMINQQYHKQILIIDFSKDKNPNIENFKIDFSLFIQAESQFKSLYLNLSDLFLEPENIISILMLIDWQFFEHVNINLRFNEMDNIATKTLRNCIRECTQLNSICLNISYNKIDEQGLIYLTNCFSAIQSLEIVHFHCVHSQIVGSIEEIYFKKNLVQLSLNFSENILSSNAIANISQALANLQILKYMGVYLSDCNIIDEDFKVLLDGFIQMKELISLSLDLSWNKITCVGIEAFKNLFKQIYTIQSFSIILSNNILDDKGCTIMFQSIQPLKQLKNLMIDVQSNSIGQYGAQDIGWSLESCKNLVCVSLIFDSVTNTQVLCTLMNQLDGLKFCLILPAQNFLKNSIYQEVGGDGVHSYSPFISPYYKMKKFKKVASCCDPYSFFEIQMFDYEKNKQDFQQFKNYPPRIEDIEYHREHNAALVLNNMSVDNYLFQIIIRHISEYYLLKKHNLLNVNCSTKSFQFNEVQCHLEDWIEQIATQVFEIKSTPSIQPDYQFFITSQQFLKKYQIFYNELLGDCSLGNIYLGKANETGEEVAIKILKSNNQKQDEQIIGFLNYNCQMGKYQGFLPIYHYSKNVIIDKVNNVVTTTFMVAIELGEILFDKNYMYKSKRGLKQLIENFISMAEIIYNLHERLLYHCDINPFKFLISNGSIKLCDTGYLKQFVLANDNVRIPLFKESKFEIGVNKYFLSPQLEYLSRVLQFRRNLIAQELQQSDIFQLGLSFLWCISQEKNQFQLRLHDFDQQKINLLEILEPPPLKKLILRMLDQKVLISSEEVLQELIQIQINLLK